MYHPRDTNSTGIRTPQPEDFLYIVLTTVARQHHVLKPKRAVDVNLLQTKYTIITQIFTVSLASFISPAPIIITLTSHLHQYKSTNISNRRHFSFGCLSFRLLESKTIFILYVYSYMVLIYVSGSRQTWNEINEYEFKQGRGGGARIRRLQLSRSLNFLRYQSILIVCLHNIYYVYNTGNS